MEVTNAVLVKSEEMPKDAQKVEELDFNKLKGPITAEDLFLGMRNMGFQATSMSEAIRIINDMVSIIRFLLRGKTAMTDSPTESVERP